MKLLLDTHTYLWWATKNTRLSLRARKAISARASEIYFSAASAYEISYKHRVGLLPAVGALVARMLEDLAERAFVVLPISLDHSLRAGDLPTLHRDPFDRLLAAQAICEDMAIITNDEKLSALGARVVW